MGALGGAIVDDDECPGSSRVLAECEDLPPCEIDCSHITCLDPRSECIIGNDGSPICVCRFPWLEDPVTNSCTSCISMRSRVERHGRRECGGQFLLTNEIKYIITRL